MGGHGNRLGIDREKHKSNMASLERYHERRRWFWHQLYPRPFRSGDPLAVQPSRFYQRAICHSMAWIRLEC